MNWEPVITTSAIALLLFFLLWLNNKFLTPWQVKRRVARLLDDIKSGKQEQDDREHTEEVRFNQDGFDMVTIGDPDAPSITMAWPEVERVVAFKLDLLMTDEIRVLLARADGSGCQLSEDMKGWVEFTQALPVHLPGCLRFEEWIGKVATPGFKTNTTEIFIRQPSQFTPA